MPSDALNRKTVREALATLIDAKFDSNWDVFNYATKDFNGKARNIVVRSGGSRRNIAGADTVEPDSGFRFRVFVFVLYADDDLSWTAQNSEDAMDTAEKDLADLFADNQTNTYWDQLTTEGETDPDAIVDEGGRVFRREIITVRTEKLV